MITLRSSLAVLSLVILAALTAPTARAGDAPPIKVQNARVLAVPPVSAETAAFMTLVNDGDRPVRLVGGSSPVAGETAPMVTTHEMAGDKMVMGMKTAPALEVPAHGRLELKPGGDHLMLMALKSVPKEGETVALTLRFEGAAAGPSELTVQAPVVRDATAAPADPTHHHGH